MGKNQAYNHCIKKLCHAKPGDHVHLMENGMVLENALYIVATDKSRVVPAHNTQHTTGLYSHPEFITLVNCETGEVVEVPHFSVKVANRGRVLKMKLEGDQQLPQGTRVVPGGMPPLPSVDAFVDQLLGMFGIGAGGKSLFKPPAPTTITEYERDQEAKSVPEVYLIGEWDWAKRLGDSNNLQNYCKDYARAGHSHFIVTHVLESKDLERNCKQGTRVFVQQAIFSTPRYQEQIRRAQQLGGVMVAIA